MTQLWSPASWPLWFGVSSELEEDAPALVDFLADEFGSAFALAEDSAGFVGDGSPNHRGIYGVARQIVDGAHNGSKVAAASGHDQFSELDAGDISALISATPEYALDAAAWYASRLGAGTLCRLSQAFGGVTVMPDRKGILRPHVAGFPIITTPTLPSVNTTLANSVMILFGDLSMAATIGSRRDLTLARSEAASLDTDTVIYRATERVAINVHSLGDNSNAGPVVGLIGTA